jgi:hypothetical protein
MRVLLAFLAAALLTGIAGCATMSVSTDYDQDVDFSEYETFNWVKQKPRVPPRRRIDAMLLDKRIKDAVEAELSFRGFRRVTGGIPDLLVAYHIGAENKVDVSTFGYRYGPRGRWVGRHVEVHRYKEGTLILDVVDFDTKQLIWRGTAVGAVYTPSDLERKLLETVGKMLDEFPPEQ